MLAAKVKDTDTSKSPYKGRVTLQFQIIVSRVLIFRFFVGPTYPPFLFGYLPPPPLLFINFPDFFLQIFQ